MARMKLLNQTKVVFSSRSVNESFARATLAAFLVQLDPTVPQLADIKTAVSEAVTNCIVHAYREKEGWVELVCKTEGNRLHIEISDRGKGIADVEQAVQPFFTTLADEERSGMGFTIMQTFMSDFSVKSEAGAGTTVTMRKDFGERTEGNAG